MKYFFGLVFLSIGLIRMAEAQPARHVILISIDGLRPEFYRDPSWPTPNLQFLMKQGVYAEGMKSVFPSYTYPAHTAMLTGALPARSGIYYNAPVGSQGEWNWYTAAIKVPTLWQAIHAAGLTSSAVEWPVSVDPLIDYNIPEIWSVKDPSDRITETRKYATKGLIEEIELNATGKLNGYTMNEEYLSLDENAGRMAAYIFKTYKPNLLALHFACVDGSQHESGREGEKVRLASASVDRGIGDVLEAVERAGLKDSTAILIVGDHGFSDIHSALRPNIWLAKKGLLQKGPHWTVKFQPAGGSAFLYLQNKDDGRTLESVRQLLNELPYRYKKLFRVIERPELDKMGADSSAQLALAALPGIVFGGASEGEMLVSATGGHHGYDPDFMEMMTGFIAAGAGINKGVVLPRIGVEDVAPLIAGLLGLNFTVPDGVLLPGILKPLKH